MNVEEIKQDFIESRQRFNERCLPKDRLNTSAALSSMKFETPDSEVVLVFDTEAFFNLPKAKQNRILKIVGR